MRKLYDQVNNTIDNLNLERIWPGFAKTRFALYNEESVYLEKDTIPYDGRFLGNTGIDYEGEKLAIWFIEDEETEDYKELSANIVHEMFHCYQALQNETRFPDDIKALSYPNNLENYNLKYNENMILVEALDSRNKARKVELLKQIIASRKLRLEKFGELIRYEFIIETVEGSAEYCGTKALEEISWDLYKNRINKYKNIVASDIKLLSDIRRSCYFTGTLFLLLLDEIGINFPKDISEQELTIFEQISALYNTENININPPTVESIKMNFEEELLRKQKLLDEFYANNPISHEGEFSICGYDPMNMFKVDNKIYCSHFITLYNINTEESIFIPGPVVITFGDRGTELVSHLSRD